MPSYILNAIHAPEAFSTALGFSETTLTGYPTFFVALSIGARSECYEDGCKAANLIVAISEVIFSLLLLVGTVAFRKRAKRLAVINDANNVYAREYAIQLHGMRKDASAEEVKQVGAPPPPQHASASEPELLE